MCQTIESGDRIKLWEIYLQVVTEFNVTKNYPNILRLFNKFNYIKCEKCLNPTGCLYCQGYSNFISYYKYQRFLDEIKRRLYKRKYTEIQ